jgi:hypothetical protein
MSTFTINDELYQRATEAAAAQGKTVDAFSGNLTSANGEFVRCLGTDKCLTPRYCIWRVCVT